jgi:glycosyltransferase involved in cell wall biosynthesis
MLTVLDSAAGVIGNSQATLDELERFACEQGRPMPPSIPAWLGVEKSLSRAADPGPTPTFVAVGTIEARKNHMLLLDLWSRLLKGSAPVPRLLLIGQRGWECDDVFQRLDRDERLRQHVVELNSCSDDEMISHVASARALLFPSLAEGFGLPLVEALAAGTPVIASDLPVFREIGQGVPELIDPLDMGAWHNAVLAYADPESPLRKAQLDRLRRFMPFRWEDHFAAIRPWLEKL